MTGPDRPYDPEGPDFLWNLLPEHHRAADLEQGSPLRRLLAALQREHLRLHDRVSLDRLNFTVETADREALARMAEMVGLPGELTPRRALVADALALVRMKGTPAALERAVEAASGWSCRVVVEGANTRVLLWPRKTARMEGVEAAPVPGKAGCFTLDPAGRDAPVLRVPGRVALGARREAWDVPELPSAGSPANSERPVLALAVGGAAGDRRVLAHEEISFGDLGAWGSVPKGKAALVDLARGRVRVAGSLGVRRLFADLGVASAGGVGGGPESRPLHRSRPLPSRWVRGGAEALAEALREASGEPSQQILVEDSARYTAPTDAIALNGRSLGLAAANGQRPTLVGTLAWSTPADRPCTLRLSGLLVVGAVRVSGPITLEIANCTLLNDRGEPSLQVDGAGGLGADAALRASVCDEVVLNLGGGALTIQGSVLHALRHDPERGPGRAVLDACSFLGEVALACPVEVDATVFAGGFAATSGAVARSLVPSGLSGVSQIQTVVRPGSARVFLSTASGHPDFAVLDPGAVPALLGLSDVGGPVGARADVNPRAEEANARRAIAHFTPLGLAAPSVEIQP